MLRWSSTTRNTVVRAELEIYPPLKTSGDMRYLKRQYKVKEDAKKRLPTMVVWKKGTKERAGKVWQDILVLRGTMVNRTKYCW